MTIREKSTNMPTITNIARTMIVIKVGVQNIPHDQNGTYEPRHEISNNAVCMCDQQSPRSACAYVQSDQSLNWSLEYSMSVKLATDRTSA